MPIVPTPYAPHMLICDTCEETARDARGEVLSFKSLTEAMAWAEENKWSTEQWREDAWTEDPALCPDHNPSHVDNLILYLDPAAFEFTTSLPVVQYRHDGTIFISVPEGRTMSEGGLADFTAALSLAVKLNGLRPPEARDDYLAWLRENNRAVCFIHGIADCYAQGRGDQRGASPRSDYGPNECPRLDVPF